MGIEFSSEELQVQQMDFAEKLSCQLKGFSEGVYVLRILDCKYNHKLENCGHTATRLKLAEGCLYFDPALGLYVPLPDTFLLQALRSAQAYCKVDCLSFHRLVNRDMRAEEIVHRLSDVEAFEEALRLEQCGNRQGAFGGTSSRLPFFEPYFSRRFYSQ